MRNARVDSDGDLRCWNCGSRALESKRTFRSKAVLGLAALATKKKLRCQACGEYNDVGSASELIELPKDEKLPQAIEFVPVQSSDAGSADLASQLSQLASLHSSGALSSVEFQAAKDRILGTAGAPSVVPSFEGARTEPRSLHLSPMTGDESTVPFSSEAVMAALEQVHQENMIFIIVERGDTDYFQAACSQAVDDSRNDARVEFRAHDALYGTHSTSSDSSKRLFALWADQDDELFTAATWEAARL